MLIWGIHLYTWTWWTHSSAHRRWYHIKHKRHTICMLTITRKLRGSDSHDNLTLVRRESAVFLFTVPTYIPQGLITKSCICIFNYQDVMHISIIIIPFGKSLFASPLKLFRCQSLAIVCFGYEDTEWETSSYLYSSSPPCLFLVSFLQLWRT